MKFASLLVLLLSTILSFAQSGGNLTVFSEDGDKFYLTLNGEKQNDKAQTNIRIEELPQPYYKAQITFEDGSILPITKNVMITDADNRMMDVTYKLKKDKSGKRKLSPYSAIEVKPDFVAPRDAYVRRYHDGITVSETTQSTTTTHTVDASVNVPGVSMNITINDPELSSTTSTTTTTTTHASGNNSQSSGGKPCRGWAMKNADFTAAKKTIQDGSFDETRLSTAKAVATANCLSTDQVVAICQLFSFEESKLDFAKFAYQFTIDPKVYFKVNSVFSFSASKEELNEYVAEQR